MRWNIEREEYYYKVYDDNGSIIAYFQPEYGQIEPREREYEIIERMLRDGEVVYSALLYMPMVKFGIDTDKDYNLDYILESINNALDSIKRWKEFIDRNRDKLSIMDIYIRRAHTDYDMLALLVTLRFKDGLRLRKKDILATVSIFLDAVVDSHLL
jgi:hypothetical protein